MRSNEAIPFFPEELWERPHWFALQTRARHEKVVHRELQKKGVETFLPLRRVTRRWSDRLKKIEEPIFSNYLFVHIPLRNRILVLETQGSVRLVGFHSWPVPISEKELAAVKLFVDEEISVDPYPYLAQGDRVYVRSGPLKGVEGFIVRKNRFARLVISIDLLMQSASVEISEALVEKI